MKKIFSSLAVSAILCATSLKAQNNAFSFNGSTYIDCGSDASLNATNIRTMECWVKFNSLANGQEILSRSQGSAGIELIIYDGGLAFYCMNNDNNATTRVSYPVSNLSTGVWYHVAATWNSTKASMVLYVNGKSVGVKTDYGTGNIDAGIKNPSGTFRIGQWSQINDNRYLQGTVDEARIWNYQRTADQIKGGMYGNVANTETGLLAYYKLNESSTITTTASSTGNTAVAGTVNGTASWVTSPIQQGSNAIAFDGVDDQVYVPNSTAFELNSGTVEFWAKPTAISTNNSCIVGNRAAAGTRYSFHMSNTAVGMYYYNSSTSNMYNSLSYPSGFVNNTWYHIAFVCNGSTTQVYVNGGLLGTLPNNAKFGTLTGLPLYIGIGKDLSGNNMEAFAGSIDEIRIWNTVRTQTEISNNMNTVYTGNESGLNALYSFNQGIVSGSNAGLITSMDATANNNHGTLLNFALTGATSNWVSSNVALLPIHLTYFSANKNKSTSVLHWATAQEINAKSFVIERSTDGRLFTNISIVNAAGNSNNIQEYTFTDINPASGTNYYRLQQVDNDGKSQYTKIVTVSFPTTELVSISPNPANSTVHFVVSSLQDTKANVSIYNPAGQKVWTSIMTVKAGPNNLMADIKSLSAGVYTLQVINVANSSTSSQQLNIVK